MWRRTNRTRCESFVRCSEVRFSALNPLPNSSSSSLANELVSIRFVSSSSSSSSSHAIRSTSAYKSSFSSAFQRNPQLSLKSLPTGKRLHFTSNISTFTRTSFTSRTPRVSTTPVTKLVENITSNATITTATSTVLRPKGLFFKRNMSIAVGLGGVSGAATACAGLGASLVLNPGLTGLLGLTQLQANATTMVALTVSALSGSGQFLTAGIVNIPVALCLSIPSVIFASLGAKHAHRFSPRALQLAFCGLLCGVIPLAIVRDYYATSQPKDTLAQQQQQHQHKWPTGAEEWKQLWESSLQDITAFDMVRHSAVGVTIGLMSGVMGIGGAFLVAAYLSIVCGMPQQEVLGTAVFGILPPALVSSAVHLRLGNVKTALLPPLLFGTIVGAVTGSHFALLIPEDVLRHIFTFVLTLIGATSICSAMRKVPK